MSRSLNSTRTAFGGSTVNGTFYRTPRRHHATPAARAEIQAQLAEVWVESDTEVQALRDGLR